jgi:hypothetical protein
MESCPFLCVFHVCKKIKNTEEEEASKGKYTLMSFIYLSDMVSFV